MNLFKLKLAIALFVFIGITSCDKGRVCECTTTYSNGDPSVVETHAPLDNTSNPDCSSYTTTTTNNGVTATTTCEVVDQ